MHGTGFAGHTLYQHSNGHSTWERMRVDDDVGLHPALRERHVDSGPFLGADTFLPVAGRELVSDDGGACHSQGDLKLLKLGVANVRACRVWHVILLTSYIRKRHTE